MGEVVGQEGRRQPLPIHHAGNAAPASSAAPGLLRPQAARGLCEAAEGRKAAFEAQALIWGRIQLFQLPGVPRPPHDSGRSVSKRTLPALPRHGQPWEGTCALRLPSRARESGAGGITEGQP